MTWDKPHSYRVIHGVGMIRVDMSGPKLLPAYWKDEDVDQFSGNRQH
jgi:hypothetical protein